MDLGDTLVASFNEVINDLVTALPAIIGALIILLVGYIIAKVASGIVKRLVNRGGVDKTFSEQGKEVYGSRTSSMTPSNLASTATFWVIMVVFFIAAANFLGWPQVSQLLNDFVAWLPNLIVAVIILIAAPLVARIVRRAVESGSEQMGMSSGGMLGRIAEIAVIAFAVLIAINQVGIAADLVNILFIGLVAGLALAFGLAFGLGGRETAAKVTERWYEQSQEIAAQAQSSAPARPRTATTGTTATAEADT